jgi:hypothetical protein
MRIRSGHIIVAVSVLLGGMLGLVLIMGGGTEAAPDAALTSNASLPPAGTDPAFTPIIEVETSEKDMGTVSNTETTRKPFVIRNKGKATLKIIQVKTSCACTQGHIPADGLMIAPGGEGTMEIEVDPRRIPGFQAHKVLTILSNDPLTPTINVGVTTHVEPEFSITPDELNFGDVAKGSDVKLTMVLKQLREEPVEINEINTFGMVKKESKEAAEFAAMSDDFVFEVVKRPESAWAQPGKAEYDISVALTREIPAGPLDGKRLYVMTNIPRVPALPVMLKGKVVAPYQLTPAAPQKLNLRADPASGLMPSGQASVTAEGGVAIEDIAPQSEHLLVTQEAGATPNEARLLISIANTAPSGPFEADVHFTVVSGGVRYPEKVGVRSFVPERATTPQ